MELDSLRDMAASASGLGPSVLMHREFVLLPGGSRDGGLTWHLEQEQLQGHLVHF